MRWLVLLALVVPLAAGCDWSPFSFVGAPSEPTVTEMRSCGELGVGIGWQLTVSPALTCRSGMRLMRTYFHGRLGDRNVMGYRCIGASAAPSIICSRDSATVVAVANH
jgi:hypothetical protein